MNDFTQEELQNCTQKGAPTRPLESLPWNFSHEHISGQTSLKVSKIDWTDNCSIWSGDIKQSGPYDFILGADIVYERTLIEPLCQVLRTVMLANPKAKTLIACTERGTTTLECFEKALTAIKAQ